MLILSDESFNQLVNITNLLFNSFLIRINNSFLNILPMNIKWLLSLTIISFFTFVLLFLLVTCIAITYFFIQFLFTKSEEMPIANKFKEAVFLVVDKIKHPKTETFSGEMFQFLLPIISIFLLIIAGWEKALPIVLYWIISNEKIYNKLKYKINPWVDAFFTVMIVFYCCLILK